MKYRERLGLMRKQRNRKDYIKNVRDAFILRKFYGFEILYKGDWI